MPRSNRKSKGNDNYKLTNFLFARVYRMVLEWSFFNFFFYYKRACVFVQGFTRNPRFHFYSSSCFISWCRKFSEEIEIFRNKRKICDV